MFFNTFATEGVTVTMARNAVLAHLRNLWTDNKNVRKQLEDIANEVKAFQPKLSNYGFNALADQADRICFPVEWEEKEAAWELHMDEQAETGAERNALSRCY